VSTVLGQTQLTRTPSRTFAVPGGGQLCRLSFEVGRDHDRAGPIERRGRRLADPGPGAGHDRQLAVRAQSG
jgi:hypothetical protein